MRSIWLIVVGISALGCRDREAATPGPAVAPAAKAARRPTPALPQARPSAPSLSVDQAFEAQAEDKLWADATERSIKAVAPDLADITCLHDQCRATLAAASEAELVAKAEALQGEAALRGLDGARNIVLTAVEHRDGKLEMKLYVRFER